MSDDVLKHALCLAQRIGGIRAGSAVRACSVPSADRDDLVQELLIACWGAAAAYDEAKAPLRVFIECVIANRLASAIRVARRKPAMLSLDTISGLSMKSQLVAFELRFDIAYVLSQIGPEDRAAALALMNYSPSEASRELGVSRSTIYRHIGRLRTAFAAAGLSSTRHVSLAREAKRGFQYQ